MEPLLDETSLVPCPVRPPGSRIQGLATTMRALDNVGAPRVLRAVRDASARDVGGGRGLAMWCFDPSTPKDAGRFVAIRLGKQPFIDGDDGLFSVAQGRRVIEAKVNDSEVIACGLAAVEDHVLIIFASDTRPAGETLRVELSILEADGDGFRKDSVEIQTFASQGEVEAGRSAIVDRIERSVANGELLLVRAHEVFPRLRLGDDARTAVQALSGREPFFRQVLRHFRVLNEAALAWAPKTAFRPALTFSTESIATLEHGKFGPLRDFHTPDGFEHQRWSLHTKLTGGAGVRLYYRPERTLDEPVVLIGYLGSHLPTVNFPT